MYKKQKMKTIPKKKHLDKINSKSECSNQMNLNVAIGKTNHPCMFALEIYHLYPI